MLDFDSSAPRFILKELILMSAAFAAAVAVFQIFPKISPPAPPSEIQALAGQYIHNPAADFPASMARIRHALASGELVLFGSSELAAPGETAIQNLYPVACGRRIVAVGHAGFQDLLALKTLAEVRELLSPKTDLVFILSPVWFTERGTPSHAFLSALRDHELPDLLRQSDLPISVKAQLALEVRSHRDEFTGLYPDYLFTIFPRLARFTRDRTPDVAAISVREGALPAPRPYDWDLAERRWRDDLARQAEGNPLGTTVEFYNRIKKYNPPYAPPKLEPWRLEQQALYALSEFLKSRGVRARFILQPIHRRVYGPLDAYDRFFAEIQAKLEGDGHAWTSYFTEPYDTSLLRDSAHFSPYGWIRVGNGLCRR